MTDRPARALFLLCLVSSFAVGCTAFRREPPPNYKTAPFDLGKNAAEAAALEKKAAKHLMRGDFAGAEEMLKRALDLDVSYGPAHNTLGKVYYHQHKLYLAAWEFQYAAKLMPDRPEPLNNLGLTFEQAGQLDDAIDRFEQARAIASTNPDVLGNLARAKVRRGDQDLDLYFLFEEILAVDDRPCWVEWAEDEIVRRRSSNPAIPVQLSSAAKNVAR